MRNILAKALKVGLVVVFGVILLSGSALVKPNPGFIYQIPAIRE